MDELQIQRWGLDTFVPPVLFDAHAHLYQKQDATAAVPEDLEDSHGNVGWAEYRKATASWLGERSPSSGLFFPFPRAGNDRTRANQFLRDELANDPQSRGLMLIAPEDDPSIVEAEVTRLPWSGFKVYHVYASSGRTFEAEIGEFLPEWAWEIANRHGLVLMLHLVRATALADPHNQTYLRDHCRRYPEAKLILAHAARGFCAHHTLQGIASLRGLENVFFDTSAICEPAPFEAILRTFGPSRLLFGTDFPVSEMLGKCISIGDGFTWLYGHNVDWSTSPFAQPVRIGLESLRALQMASIALSLRDTDHEWIFAANARRLLRIDQPAGCRPESLTASRYQVAKQRIPGGTQLLSKRPEMYAPGKWPAYFREAHGCEVIDLDGNRYLDMTTSGIGSCLLGYADPDVNAAVSRRVLLGSMSTLNAVEELELAEALIQLHPWADLARFTRSGGEAMAVAIRLARAATGRETIAFCGYHGWSDWYLAANLPEEAAAADPLAAHLLPGLDPRGVPQGLAGTMLPFGFNRIDELAAHVERQGEQIAAIVMEPTRAADPDPGFLQAIRDLANRCGALLLFDEISSGWRLHLGGVHLKYGVSPDIAVFAKAMSNGYPMAAILGRRIALEAAQRTFVSSTFWTEGIGPTAALATLAKMKATDVPGHVAKIGELMRSAWLEIGKKHGVPTKTTGHPALLSLSFDHVDSLALITLTTTRLLERGILFGGGFYPSLAHESRHVDRCADALNAVIPELATAIAHHDVLARLGGAAAVRHAGFARLT